MELMASLLLATYGGCLLAILLLFLWRELRIEVFRQRIFQIRDELFDFAAEGNISFNDPAYGALRTSMNSLIRFAHKMSFFHAFLMNLARHWYPSPALERAFKQRMRPWMSCQKVRCAINYTVFIGGTSGRCSDSRFRWLRY